LNLAIRVSARVVACIALAGCAAGGVGTRATPADTADPSNSSGKATPDLSGAKPVNVSSGTMQLVIAPAVAKEGDSVFVLTNGAGINDLECSDSADKEICASTLQGFAKLWQGSTDGWSTGQTTWQPLDGESPALGVLLRSRFAGDRDLVATVNGLYTGPTATPTAPTTTEEPTPTDEPTPIYDPNWAEILIEDMVYCWGGFYDGLERTDEIVPAVFHTQRSPKPVPQAGARLCGGNGDWVPNGYPDGRGIFGTGTCQPTQYPPDLSYYDTDRRYPGWRDLDHPGRDLITPADSTLVGMLDYTGVFSACYNMGWHDMLH